MFSSGEVDFSRGENQRNMFRQIDTVWLWSEKCFCWRRICFRPGEIAIAPQRKSAKYFATFFAAGKFRGRAHSRVSFRGTLKDLALMLFHIIYKGAGPFETGITLCRLALHCCWQSDLWFSLASSQIFDRSGILSSFWRSIMYCLDSPGHGFSNALGIFQIGRGKLFKGRSCRAILALTVAEDRLERFKRYI